MKKLSNIMESIWSDMQDRGTGEIEKRETFIKEYNSAVQYILDRFYDDDTVMYVVNIRDSRYTPDEMVNIRKWTAPYTFMIYEGGHGTDLILDFEPYDVLKENEYELCELVSEKNYPEICKGIAKMMKEIGDHISYVHSRAWIIPGNYDISKYQYNYIFELISENDVSYWASEEENQDRSRYDSDFIHDIQNRFPALKYQDFIGWSFNNYGGMYFGIPISYDNLMGLKDYIEYTQKWFEVK